MNRILLIKKVTQGTRALLLEKGAEVHVTANSQINTVLLFNGANVGVGALAAELPIAAIATATTCHFGSIIARAWFSHGSISQLPP